MKLNVKEFHNALAKINKVTPYLSTPSGALVIDISYGKVRVADSVQFWQVKAESLPDMQLIRSKAVYLEKLLSTATNIEFETTSSHHIFKFDSTIISLARPVFLSYNNIEEVFLKPTLVNDLTLETSVEELKDALTKITEVIQPSVIGMQIQAENVILTGRDLYDNAIEQTIPASFDGKDLSVAFPAPELLTLTQLLEDKITTFKLGAGTKTRPSALLAEDKESGLTCVLSPMHP